MSTNPSLDPIRWRQIEDVTDEMTPIERQWLAHAGSLTKRLRAVAMGKIVHQIRYEDWGLPELDEAQYLGASSTQPLFIRETDWCYQGEINVTTRALIPATTLQIEGAQLQTIGTRSLGDFLFADPSLKRSTFEFTRLMLNQKTCWARRSIFYYFGEPLLVSEIFFSEIFNMEPPADA